MENKTPQKKDAILDAAYSLFEEKGFHATGVDAIAERSKTTKRTLYRIFGSKENLALEVIRTHDQQFRRHICSEIEGQSKDPRERLIALFDYYGKWFVSEKFRGCLFIKAIVEFQVSSPKLRDAARESKEQLRSYIEGLCVSLGAKKPVQLSARIQILLEGSIVAAQARPGCDSAGIAREIATTLIDESLELSRSE